MENTNIRQDLVAGTRPEIDGGRVLLTGAEGFDGYEITSYLGMVWGITVRAKDMGQDCAMGCKQFTGGEMKAYSQLGNESRQQSVDRMITMAKRIGATGIINIEFELSGMSMGASEVVVHGTAVKIEAIKDYVPAGAVGNILLEIKEEINKQ